jgi:hypothetical protein
VGVSARPAKNLMMTWEDSRNLGRGHYHALSPPFRVAIPVHGTKPSHRIDQQLQSNDHHAEVQLLRWIERQNETWRARTVDIELSITHSPCLLCTADLVAALRGRPLGHAGKGVALIKPKRAALSWGRVYQNEPQGLSTTLQHIQDLLAAKWERVTLDEPVHRFRRRSPMPDH